MIIFIIFLLGLAIGSFINALLYRMENKLSMQGRSICPDCKKEIKWYDLVPVVSWIILRGKCRNCSKAISFQYPLVEIITALSFVLVSWKSGLTAVLNDAMIQNTEFNLGLFLNFVSLFLLLAITTIFIIIALYDAKTTYILSKYVYFGIFLSIILLLINFSIQGIFSTTAFFDYLFPFVLSSFVPALYFFSLYFLSKGKWMGAGDIELALFMGLLLGWPKILIAYFFAFLVGAIWGLILIVKNKAKMKSELPFGPFLVAGAFFGFLFGEQLFNLYVKIFLGV